MGFGARVGHPRVLMPSVRTALLVDQRTHRHRFINDSSNSGKLLLFAVLNIGARINLRISANLASDALPGSPVRGEISK
ncbi:hypothetical protein [Methylibium sp.]|uniref:hypothetical protein n=1 Tax=Methylibium sp. TaxID=2067992 RepID=UPI003D0F424D